MNSKRIWEIDALRGFLILCVIVCHSLFFGDYMLGLYHMPACAWFIIDHGGVLFVILSGLSATLGSRSFRRGVYVFCGGMLLTLGSVLGVHLGFLDSQMVIRFGVLHLLGICMMLYPLLKKLPTGSLAALGGMLVILGWWFAGLRVQTPLLFPLGLTSPGFSSGDYFPICPHLGWFCLGIVLGRMLYPGKQTRIPGIDPQKQPWRFFTFCGRHSMVIFVLHLPVVGILMYGLSLLFK